MIFLSNFTLFKLRNREYNAKGTIVKKEKKDFLKYLEFARKMNMLSTQKRKVICEKKKNYCNELIKNIKNDIK